MEVIIVQSLKLYKQRGNKRIIEFYDERLQKKILLGNENIRPLSTWKKEFGKFNLKIEEDSINYVRAFPPALFNYWGYDLAIEKEQLLAKNSNLAQKYLFFGINFVAKKLH